MSTTEGGSPRWGTTTKALVAVTGLVLLGALLVRFQSLIPLLVMAGIVAYLLLPIVRTLHFRARLSWTAATNIGFLYLILLLILAFTALSLAGIQQLQGLFGSVQSLLTNLPGVLSGLSRQTLALGPWQIRLDQFDLAPLGEQALAVVQPVLGRASDLVTSLATRAIASLARLVFVLAVAYFATLDFDQLRAAWSGLSLPRFESDLDRLRRALERIWHSFLRGQLLVVLITGVLTGILMTALGLRFSIGLGVLGGVAKFVPIVGPITAGAVAALVALFQPGNWFGVSPLGHAVLVIVCTIVLDQLIDYLLVPRIMGSSLNLHPVVILIGALLGASLAGVVGLLLSAPAVASLLLLGRYAFRKLFDLSPWDPPIDAGGQARVPVLTRWWLRRRALRRRKGTGV